MRDVTLSKERWYVTADKTRKVPEGDPEAAFLLVGKGGAISPDVAAFYGVETYTGTAIEKVSSTADEVKSAMVTHGTGKETAENYERMRIQEEARQSVEASAVAEGNRSATRQAAMMADARIAQGDFKAPESSSEPEAVTSTRTKEIGGGDSGDGSAADASDAGGNTENGQALEQSLKKTHTELENAISSGVKALGESKPGGSAENKPS